MGSNQGYRGTSRSSQRAAAWLPRLFGMSELSVSGTLRRSSQTCAESTALDLMGYVGVEPEGWGWNLHRSSRREGSEPPGTSKEILLVPYPQSQQ